MKTKYTISIFLFLIFLISCTDESKMILEKWDNGTTKKEKKWIDKESNSFKELAYYESGQIKLEKDYNKGELYIFKAYYETGEISALLMYNNDKAIIGAEYYKNGQRMGNVPTNLDGEINGTATYFYENGKIRSEVEFLNDSRVSSKEYDTNGLLTAEYIAGKKVNTKK